MKKIYLTATALVVATGAFAQSFVQTQQEISSVVAKEIQMPIGSTAAATPTDTLGFAELGINFVQYASDAGYIFGTSSFEFPAPTPPGTFQFSREFARGFIVNDAHTVIGAGFAFALKEDVSGDPSAVTAKLYYVEPESALEGLESTAFDVDGPSTTVVASGDIAFADADTSGLITWVDFDTEGWVPSDFAIGLDITSLYSATSDTLALLADENGDSDGNYTWSKIVQGASVNGQALWVRSGSLFVDPLLVNLAIFAVVAESGVGIEEQAYLNGVKATTFPNPALTSDNVTIQYGVDRTVENVEVSIYNMSGQVVYTSVEGGKTSGNYNVNVPAGTLSAGTYTYLVQADDSRIAKRMEILK